MTLIKTVVLIGSFLLYLIALTAFALRPQERPMDWQDLTLPVALTLLLLAMSWASPQ